MFNNKQTKEERPGLDMAIDHALTQLQNHSPDSSEYIKIVDQLERLYKLQVPSAEPAKPVSKDAIIAVVGNIAGIVMILGYEKAHVITTKALGFVIKSKL